MLNPLKNQIGRRIEMFTACAKQSRNRGDLINAYRYDELVAEMEALFNVPDEPSALVKKNYADHLLIFINETYPTEFDEYLRERKCGLRRADFIAQLISE